MHLQENTLNDRFSYKFLSCYVKMLRRRCIYKKVQYLTFDLDLDLWVKVTRNVAQYPLHHMTYSATKFEVATSHGLGGDTFTRNVTDGGRHGWTDRQTDRLTDRRTEGRTTDRL